MNYKNTLLLLLLSIGLVQCAPKTNRAYPSSTVYGNADEVVFRGVTYNSFNKLTANLDSLPASMKKSWNMWKSEKWESLETYYEKNNYNGEYPPAQGFVSIDTVILKDDTRIDRYGSLWGTFVAPTGTPFGERALPASSKTRVYYRFEVVKDLPGVLKGPAIPWFSMPGMGTQYMLPKNMKTLIKEGYVIVLDSIVPKGKVDKYND